MKPEMSVITETTPDCFPPSPYSPQRPIEQQEHVPIVTPEIDELIGLNGNVRSVETLQHGMSGGKVLHITTDTDMLVLKYNPDFPQKVQQEITGYEKLRETPLAKRLTKPRFVSADHALMVLPYHQGIQLREGVRQESIPQETAVKTLAQLLAIKKQWWAEQPRTQTTERATSMQREEWQDTKERLTNDMQTLAETLHISQEALWTQPLQFAEQEFPSLSQIIHRVDASLQESPPYILFTHGDATGANIIVNPKDEDWRLIDAEWAGYADPAEAYVRMVKYLSTTTIQDMHHISAQEANGKLRLAMDITFPQTAITLQQYGIKTAPIFGTALQDPTFMQRVQEYLAGSYLREMALATKRGDPRFAMIAYVKAGEALTL